MKLAAVLWWIGMATIACLLSKVKSQWAPLFFFPGLLGSMTGLWLSELAWRAHKRKYYGKR